MNLTGDGLGRPQLRLIFSHIFDIYSGVLNVYSIDECNQA